MLRRYFQMVLAEEEEIVLYPQGDRLVMSEGFNEGQHRFNGFVESGVGPAMDLRCLYQRIQLCDELKSQHHQLLVEDISRF